MRVLRGIPLLSILAATLVAADQKPIAESKQPDAGSSSGSHDGQISLAGDACIDPPYKIHIFSSSPLVMYIEDFLHADERLHLLEITKGTFSSSAVADESGTEVLRSTQSSQSTRLPRDPITQCIERRALSIQGFDIGPAQMEALQMVQYANGGKYHWYNDWFASATKATTPMGGNRLSSFSVYVSAANVTGGGTNFPMLEPPTDDRWCSLVNCDEELDKGVTFRPKEGNAIFWRNMVHDGKGWRGDERTLHADLPVERGVKVGMNIWTREGEISDEFRSAV